MKFLFFCFLFLICMWDIYQWDLRAKSTCRYLSLAKLLFIIWKKYGDLCYIIWCILDCCQPFTTEQWCFLKLVIAGPPTGCGSGRGGCDRDSVLGRTWGRHRHIQVPAWSRICQLRLLLCGAHSSGKQQSTCAYNWQNLSNIHAISIPLEWSMFIGDCVGHLLNQELS